MAEGLNPTSGGYVSSVGEQGACTLKDAGSIPARNTERWGYQGPTATKTDDSLMEIASAYRLLES